MTRIPVVDVFIVASCHNSSDAHLPNCFKCKRIIIINCVRSRAQHKDRRFFDNPQYVINRHQQTRNVSDSWWIPWQLVHHHFGHIDSRMTGNTVTFPCGYGRDMRAVAIGIHGARTVSYINSVWVAYFHQGAICGISYLKHWNGTQGKVRVSPINSTVESINMDSSP